MYSEEEIVYATYFRNIFIKTVSFIEAAVLSLRAPVIQETSLIEEACTGTTLVVLLRPQMCVVERLAFPLATALPRLDFPFSINV